MPKQLTSVYKRRILSDRSLYTNTVNQAESAVRVFEERFGASAVNSLLKACKRRIYEIEEEEKEKDSALHPAALSRNDDLPDSGRASERMRLVNRDSNDKGEMAEAFSERSVLHAQVHPDNPYPR